MNYYNRSFKSYKPKSFNRPNMQGNGIVSTVLNFIHRKRPRIVNDFINKNKYLDIIKIEVCRSPVLSIFTKFINVLSFGRLNKNLKNKPYDELFHLYMILHLSDGKQYLLEKNQRLFIGIPPKKTDKTECKEIIKTINVNEFFTKAEKENENNENFYRYSALGGANCQNYIKNMLNAHDIYEFDNFVMQDTKELVPKYVKSITNTITDIASIGDYIYRGGANYNYN